MALVLNLSLSCKKNLGTNFQFEKSRISPLQSPIFPPRSNGSKSLHAKALINNDNGVLSEDENSKFPNSLDHKPYNTFPPNFVFGAASSAYQVEGGAKAGGKGPSIWDTFCEKYPEKIADRSSGETAAGSYYHYKEDVQLLADIGLKAYRFSICWPRVLPKGRGKPNPDGINYYHRLIDELKLHGIEPYVTLFHWDVPQALEDEYGGFLSRKIVEDFKNYVKLCFDEFGNKVKHWITINEPSIFSTTGYADGTCAPGHCTPDLKIGDVEYTCPVGDSLREPYKVGHNLLLAHAEAANLYKTQYQTKQKGKVGITLTTRWHEPYDNSPTNKEAQQRTIDFNLGWFMDPLKFGNYPYSMQTLVGERLPSFTPEESLKLKESYDFIGLNYYTARYAKHKLYTGKPQTIADDPQVEILVSRYNQPIGPAEPNTRVNVYPKGLYKLLLHMKERYNNPPIYITENGVYEMDDKSKAKQTDDIYRSEYHTAHLHELENALSARVDIRGYFVWSLLDSFEWNSGYTNRFGLTYIHYDDVHETDLRRIPKQSSGWLKRYLSNISSQKEAPLIPLLKEVAETVTAISTTS